MTAAETIEWARATREERPHRFAHELHQMTVPEMAASLDITAEQAIQLHASVTSVLTAAAVR